MESFLRRTYYLDGGHDNKQGMLKLNAKMELYEVIFHSLYYKLASDFTMDVR